MRELAEFLKNKRLNRDLTIEALSRLSGISVYMLASFEGCDFERFDACVFLRNTIRAYCEALHIDAEPLIQKYCSQIEACNIQDAGIRRYGQRLKTIHKHRRMIALPLFVLFFVSAVVFYGGTWVSQRRSKLFAPPNANRVFSQEDLPVGLHERPAAGREARVGKPGPGPGKAYETTKNADTRTVKPENTAGKATVAGGTEKQAEASPKDLMTDNGPAARFSFSNSTDAIAGEGPVWNAQTSTPNKFTVEADGKVWIEVKIDDKKPRAEMLHPGDHREWVAAKTLEVVIGNAGGIRMKWNDRPLQAPRVAGRVLRFRLPDYAKAEQG